VSVPGSAASYFARCRAQAASHAPRTRRALCSHVSDERTSEYRFRTSLDAETGHLMVACEGRYFEADREFHYVNELVLEDGGASLWSYTIERNGQSFVGDQRPRRKFTKVSDGIARPPRPPDA